MSLYTRLGTSVVRPLQRVRLAVQDRALGAVLRWHAGQHDMPQGGTRAHGEAGCVGSASAVPLHLHVPAVCLHLKRAHVQIK